MRDSTRDNSTSESFPRQGRRYVPAPRVVSELLTAREAIARFPGLTYKRLYAAAAEGRLLHPVRPAGRTLYPEWELASLVEPRYLRGFDADSRAA